mgnify:CR=1 FL=1
MSAFGFISDKLEIKFLILYIAARVVEIVQLVTEGEGHLIPPLFPRLHCRAHQGLPLELLIVAGPLRGPSGAEHVRCRGRLFRLLGVPLHCRAHQGLPLELLIVADQVLLHLHPTVRREPLRREAEADPAGRPRAAAQKILVRSTASHQDL